jgi:hypothetical protein
MHVEIGIEAAQFPFLGGHKSKFICSVYVRAQYGLGVLRGCVNRGTPTYLKQALRHVPAKHMFEMFLGIQNHFYSI